MGKRNRIRPFTILLLFATVVLIVVFQNSLRGPDIPPGGRLKLPTGPVKPMVSMGLAHGMILAGDGSLWSWGTNHNGWPVLGLSNVTEAPYLRRIGKDTNWVSVNAGDSHNVAVKSDGTFWAWGMNIYGQFGNGGKTPASANEPMAGAPGNDWKQAAAGGSHTVALKKDGTIWAWGNNWAGQLGIGTTNDAFAPTQIGSGTNWVRVWAGSLHGAAQQSDGTLWIWGSNPTLPSQVARTNSNLLAPVQISAETNWVDASFGNSVFLAIKSDGTLWAWGNGSRVYRGGQDASLNATFMRVGTNSDWKSVTSAYNGSYHLLTKKDGSVWGLGAMYFVQANVPPNPIVLTRIELPKGYAAWDSTRGEVGVVLTPDGEVWTWGRAIGLTTRANPPLQRAAAVARKLGWQVHWGEPQPIVREKPWLLPNIDPDASK